MSILSFAKKIAGRKEEEKAKPAPVKSRSTVASKKKETAEAAAQPVTPGMVTLSPLLSEKSVAQQAGSNTVVFRAGVTATKGQIAAAVRERYRVTPVSVRTLRQLPKQRRRGQTYGQTTAWKKAYVTLAEGETIDFTV